jgi:TolB protein
MKSQLIIAALFLFSNWNAHSGSLMGHQLLLTSVRTGDTEIFVVDPETGDAKNLSRSPDSEDRYPCWSPDGKRRSPHREIIPPTFT